jgi:hypothetical protein
MAIPATILARFDELILSAEKIKATKWTPTGPWAHDYVNHEQARQWTMSALAIVKSSLGEDCDNYQEIKKLVPKCALYHEFGILVANLKAAFEDLKGGYFFEARKLIEAEVCNDFMEQASELQNAGYKDAAAVIAGGVLEKHLRTMCGTRGIGPVKPNGKHKMINDMNDELAKAGAYNAHKKKQITAWADLRNNAAHGNYAAYTNADIDAFLRDVTDFFANFT